MKKVRIMIFNVGYLTGITGRIWEYLFGSIRFVFPNMFRKKDILRKLTNLIEQTKPDILFLAEVRDESYMTSIKNLFVESHIDIKYDPKSVLNSLPFFSGNCNGVFLRNPLPVKKLFIKNGTKKLLYQIDISDNCSILFSHFALGAKTREKQFSELAKIARGKQVIIGGDFNIFKGTNELQALTKESNVHLINNQTDKTFPSYKPVHLVDLFLASSTIKAPHIEVLNDILISDHLPVVADFEF
jgi:endonuclease/exonuclease/phosphatase family metal-dependent hydrolase